MIRAATAAIVSLINSTRFERQVSPDPFLHFQRFILLWADQVHHSKEEGVLFPELARAGMKVDEGLAEHEQERELAEMMGAMARACQAGDWSRQAKMLDAAVGYCTLLAQHIDKEDLVLYPAARHLLSAETLASFPARFTAVDSTSPAQFEEAAEAVVRSAQTACRMHAPA